jgi:Holliday junction resolvasome RuvABC endonuclease subunit
VVDGWQVRSPVSAVCAVMGLDLSLTATGIAYPDGLASVVRSKKKGAERLVEIRAWIETSLLNYDTDLVVIEGPAFGRPNGMHALGQLAGVVYVRLHELKQRHLEVPPSCVKKYATGKGNAKKVDVLQAAWKRLGYEGTDDNEADALWLRAVGMELLGEPVVDVPALHRTALDKLRVAS